MARTTRRTRRWSTVAALPAAVALAGCAVVGVDLSPPTSVPPAISIEVTPDANAVRNGSGAENAEAVYRDDLLGPDGATPAVLQASVKRAAVTALTQIYGTVVFVDGDPSRWWVTVVVPSGNAYDIELTPDARRVTRAAVQPLGAGADAEQRVRLLRAPVDYVTAVDVAQREMGGTATAVGLFEENGRALWAVQLELGSRDADTLRDDEVTVHIDARTAEIVDLDQRN